MRNIITIILIMMMNYIYSGPLLGQAACNACCTIVHAPEAGFPPLYLGMVAKCVIACLAALVPGCPPAPSDPRDMPCLIAEKLIAFAPTA